MLPDPGMRKQRHMLHPGGRRRSTLRAATNRITIMHPPARNKSGVDEGQQNYRDKK